MTGDTIRRGLGGIAAAALLAAASAAEADLIYRPVNPAFGGAPNNAVWLLESANIQNRFKESRDPFRRLTPAEEFAETLQRRLLWNLSDEIVRELREGDAPEGEFRVEGTVIRYLRVGNNVRLIIDDGVSQSEILIPARF